MQKKIRHAKISKELGRVEDALIATEKLEELKNQISS